MKRKFPFIWIILLVFILNARAFAIESISIAATKRSIDNFEQFTQGKVAANIDHFDSKPCTRQVVDILLVLKALKIAGFPDVRVVFKEVPNSARERAAVKSGMVVLGENDHWDMNFDDSVFMTDPIVMNGEFEKGIYIDPKPSNYELLYVNSLESLRNYTAVMVATWYVDWKTLEQMGIKNLEDAATAEGIFRMLHADRARFTLYEFSAEEDFSRTVAGIRLIPIPGIKVGLSGSRHLMISKIHPKGETVYHAVQKGLKELRKSGVIQRALTECGFLERRVADWKKIN